MITTGGRVRSFLGWAFVLSIAIHFLLAPVFPRLNQRTEEQEVEKVSVTKKIIVKVPTPPPPTPTPKPTPQPQTTAPPQQKPQPQLKINVVHTTSKSSTSSSQNRYVAPKSGTEQGVPQGQGTAAPSQATAPPGTPKPACRNPYQDATVVQQAQADYPESARDLGMGEVTVQVQVTIAPSGALIGTRIFQSGGNMAFDRAAMAAARESSYSPKVVNCEPVTGDYIFKVTFDPNS